MKCPVIEARRWIATGILLAVLGSAVGADDLAENQARFGVVTGQVMVLAQGAADWVDAHEGLPLEPGDHVRTGDDGRAEIVLSENVVWVLDPDTDFLPEHMDQQNGRFNLASGALMGKVDSARATLPQHWEFNTPTAVCAVRGTEFALDASRPEATDLAVFEGEVEMRPAESAMGEGEPMRVGAQQEAVFARGRPPRRLAALSAAMRTRFERRADLRARLARIQNTWSPFTWTTRRDARGRFITKTNRLPKARTAPIRRRHRRVF